MTRLLGGAGLVVPSWWVLLNDRARFVAAMAAATAGRHGELAAVERSVSGARRFDMVIVVCGEGGMEMAAIYR